MHFFIAFSSLPSVWTSLLPVLSFPSLFFSSANIFYPPPSFLKSVRPFVLSFLFSSRPVCPLHLSALFIILLSLSSWLLPRSISPSTFVSSDNLLSFLSVLSSFVLFFPIFCLSFIPSSLPSHFSSLWTSPVKDEETEESCVDGLCAHFELSQTDLLFQKRASKRVCSLPKKEYSLKPKKPTSSCSDNNSKRDLVIKSGIIPVSVFSLYRNR